jgi:antitoxin HigA-1
MFQAITAVKGIHPGVYLERELKKRNISKGRFSLSIQEYPQTFVAVTKGKRRMNPSLALRIERELKLEEGFLMTLQGFYDMEVEKRKISSSVKPNLQRFRPALFWEADLAKLNWELQQSYIIRRVMERGTKQEQQELASLYEASVIKHFSSGKA